ncbi:MAG TPA: hypothetical protein VNI79_07765 [Sphingomicrobium sp.]|nr:hypothetical protein [Sphingomicrobium sp.]
MKQDYLFLGAAVALALGACQPSSEVVEAGNDNAEVALADEASDTDDGDSKLGHSPSQDNSHDQPRGDPNAPPGPPPPPPAAPIVNTSIPDALHGRWGLVAADCDPSTGGAKGLITVSADKIRFWESTARLVKLSERMPDRIQGDFAFSGEGQSWTKHMRWLVSGKKLSRFEGEGDTAMTYTRC